MAHVNREELTDGMASYVLGRDEVEAFFPAPSLMLVNELSDFGRVGR